jgi:hypothetical protein
MGPEKRPPAIANANLPVALVVIAGETRRCKEA